MGVVSEKDVLPQTATDAASPITLPPKRARLPSILGYILASWVVLRFFLLPVFVPSLSPYPLFPHHAHHDTPSSSCVQATPVLPQAFDVSALVPGNEVRIREWLSGAVKIPTEMFDVMGPIGEDPRWDIFYKFSECTPVLLHIDVSVDV